jgi:arylsulfatase A-like enzyme
MEVYATLVESADHEVGRLVDAIENLGELDNTLFIYISGDNGIVDRRHQGRFRRVGSAEQCARRHPVLLSRLDEYGGPASYPIIWTVLVRQAE